MKLAAEMNIRATGGFSPHFLGGGSLQFWARADRGVTLGGTMRASGTTPPVVGISGSLTPAVGLHLEIDSVAGGTGLGQATFKWSVDNGTTYVQTGVVTAASVVLGSTGITATFAAGPYNIDNKWDATVAAWADLSGKGANATMATAAFQPQFAVAGINGKPAINYAASNQNLRTGATAVTLTADSMFGVVKLNSTGNFMLFTHFDGVNNRWVFTGTADSLRSQVGGVTSGKNAAAGAGWVSTTAQSVGRTYNGTHVTSLAWKNMVAVATTDTAVADPGIAASPGQMNIGNNAGFSAAISGFLSELVVYSAALSATEMSKLQNYFHLGWLI